MPKTLDRPSAQSLWTVKAEGRRTGSKARQDVTPKDPQVLEKIRKEFTSESAKPTAHRSEFVNISCDRLGGDLIKF